VHQGKTGGASLVKSFRNAFGEEFSYRDIDNKKRRENSSYPWMAYYHEKLEKHRRYKGLSTFSFIHGHFSPEKYRKAFPDALYLTFYRHPIQKLISLYYFWQRPIFSGAIHPNRKILLDNKLTLIEFAKLTNSKRNRILSSKFDPKNFDFVGITESYTGSIALLNKTILHNFGFSIKEETRNANPKKDVDSKYDLDADTYKNLCGIFEQELNQYSEAVSVFRANCDKVNVEVS
jgi:hypothetical protein